MHFQIGQKLLQRSVSLGNDLLYMSIQCHREFFVYPDVIASSIVALLPRVLE